MNKYLQLFIGGSAAGLGQYLSLNGQGVEGKPLLLGALLTALVAMAGMLKTLPKEPWTEAERSEKLGKEF